MDKFLQVDIESRKAIYWRGFFMALLAVDLILGLAVVASILIIK